MKNDKIWVAGGIFLVFPTLFLLLSIVVSFIAWEVLIPQLFVWRLSFILGVMMAVWFWFDTDENGNIVKKEENDK